MLFVDAKTCSEIAGAIVDARGTNGEFICHSEMPAGGTNGSQWSRSGRLALVVDLTKLGPDEPARSA